VWRPYASEGRPSIPPEQSLSALLLQVFYGVRSERQLMEQVDYNLLYRWFVGLSVEFCKSYVLYFGASAGGIAML
jgi:transposase